MKAKRTIKSVIALMLVLCAVLSFAACKKEQEKSDGKLANQYHSQKYYFRQGYTENWKVKLSGTDGAFVEDHADQKLALQLVPFEKSTDSEGKVTVGTTEAVGVQYNVFCNWGTGTSLVSSQNDIVKNVMDEDKRMYFFNNVNYIDVTRDSYRQTVEEAKSVTYNDLQWQQVTFEFVGEDNVQWKGIWNLLTNGVNYYIVSYEAHADKYATYEADFLEMIDDFKKVAMEQDNKVG